MNAPQPEWVGIDHADRPDRWAVSVHIDGKLMLALDSEGYVGIRDLIDRRLEVAAAVFSILEFMGYQAQIREDLSCGFFPDGDPESPPDDAPDGEGDTPDLGTADITDILVDDDDEHGA